MKHTTFNQFLKIFLKRFKHRGRIGRESFSSATEKKIYSPDKSHYLRRMWDTSSKICPFCQQLLQKQQIPTKMYFWKLLYLRIKRRIPQFLNSDTVTSNLNKQTQKLAHKQLFLIVFALSKF